MKTLSRNKPVALVVGAAGFLGSSLVQKLLEKGVSVVGVDNLSTGQMENLTLSSNNSNFYFLNKNFQEKVDFDLPRLDYAYLVVAENIEEEELDQILKRFLEEIKQYRAKAVLVSTINLYEKDHQCHLLEKAEKKLAEFALEHKLNARVVRLAPVFGPRMHFRENDPIGKLIISAINNQLQKEISTLDFTSRAIYIEDAVNLLVKAMMHGATAQKIYDGALVTPIKVSEIKQVLLDPLWHEQQGFQPTQLPPWPTPNLEKTTKELSWKPDSDLVAGLKATLHYFKERPEKLVAVESKPTSTKHLDEEKEQLLKEIYQRETNTPKQNQVREFDYNKFKNWGMKVTKAMVIGLITLAIVLPIAETATRSIIAWQKLEEGTALLQKGQFQTAKISLNEANKQVNQLAATFWGVSMLGNWQLLTQPVVQINTTYRNLARLTQAASEAADGGESLVLGIATVSGASEQPVDGAWQKASGSFRQAQQVLSAVTSQEDSFGWLNGLTNKLSNRVLQQLNYYQNIAGYGSAFGQLLGILVPSQQTRNYLVVLTDNTILREGGGRPVALAWLSFENGRIKPIIDLDLADLTADSNFDHQLAFQTSMLSSGSLIEKTYHKQSGRVADGVMMIDLWAAGRLLETVGPIDLKNGNTTIDSGNISSRLTALPNNRSLSREFLKELLNRLLFLPENNWIAISAVFDQAFRGKNTGIYLTDNKALSQVNSLGWADRFPVAGNHQAGERVDLIAVTLNSVSDQGRSFSGMGNYQLEVNLNQAKTLTYHLEVTYQSAEPSSKKLRIYLPSDCTIKEAKWNNQQLTQLSSFAEAGWSGYTANTQWIEGENKLALACQTGQPVKLVDGKLRYQLTAFKQAGTKPGQLSAKMTLPEDLTNKPGSQLNYQEEFGQNLTWEVELTTTTQSTGL